MKPNSSATILKVFMVVVTAMIITLRGIWRWGRRGGGNSPGYRLACPGGGLGARAPSEDPDEANVTPAATLP